MPRNPKLPGLSLKFPALMLVKDGQCSKSRRQQQLQMVSKCKNPQANFSRSAAAAVPEKVLASYMVVVLQTWVLASERVQLII